MVYVKVTIAGEDIYLEETAPGIWSILTEAPSYPGVYPITVTVKNEAGSITIIGYDDATLGEILKLLVAGEPRTRLIQYLPPFLQSSSVYRGLFQAAGNEVDWLQDTIQVIIDDAYILSATEARIKEWEKALQIIPSGTLSQRKTFIISILRGQGKLNEARIKNIVKAFTGGDAIVNLIHSALDVKVLSPDAGDIYLFPDIERALLRRVPAHIGLTVQRWYSSWKDIKQNYAEWTTVSGVGTWQNLKDYIPPQ